ncbi:MAG: hypothetical protein K0U34_06920 [Alphaproteobacteria bacterium]|nr:hypothetical protein [Alphaproteobacteria bacterium]
MKRMFLSAAALAALSMLSAPPVMANDVTDTVRARGNARAGGPTNAHDAWILDRYGALSGTYTNGSTYDNSTTSLSAYKLRKLRKSY